MRSPRVDYDGRYLVASHGLHSPKRIVLHDTESHDARGIRDLAGIATYWHGVSWGPGAQLGVDAEGYTARYVDDDQLGYHVEGRNTGSLGIEMVGFARFVPSVWGARRAQLEKVAQWMAWWAREYQIPLVLSTDRGVSTHAMQSRQFGGDHYDPGRFFPLKQVLARAKQIYAGHDPKPVKKPAYMEKAYWRWLRWTLGEGEYRGHGFDNHVRPGEAVGVPARIPKTWWARRAAFVRRRKASAGE